MLTLIQKIKLIRNLRGCNGGIRDEANFAQDALAREERRHQSELRAIVERFERDAWHYVEKNWTQEEIQAARELR